MLRQPWIQAYAVINKLIEIIKIWIVWHSSKMGLNRQEHKYTDNLLYWNAHIGNERIWPNHLH